MEYHMESSLKIAQFLQSHPMVEKVLHPGKPNTYNAMDNSARGKGHRLSHQYYVFIISGDGNLFSFRVVEVEKLKAC